MAVRTRAAEEPTYRTSTFDGWEQRTVEQRERTRYHSGHHVAVPCTGGRLCVSARASHAVHHDGRARMSASGETPEREAARRTLCPPGRRIVPA